MLINQRMILFLAVTLGVVVMLAGAPVEARQGGSFSSHDLQGAHGFAFDGVLMTDDGPVPISAVGQLTWNGRGGATAVRTLNIGGLFLLKQTAVGRYTINRDGTVEAEFEVTTVDPPGAFPTSTETFEGVISNNGHLVQFISTGGGVVARGRTERQ